MKPQSLQCLLCLNGAPPLCNITECLLSRYGAALQWRDGGVYSLTGLHTSSLLGKNGVCLCVELTGSFVLLVNVCQPAGQRAGAILTLVGISISALIFEHFLVFRE